jgi:hypothetical protein
MGRDSRLYFLEMSIRGFRVSMPLSIGIYGYVLQL